MHIKLQVGNIGGQFSGQVVCIHYNYATGIHAYNILPICIKLMYLMSYTIILFTQKSGVCMSQNLTHYHACILISG